MMTDDTDEDLEFTPEALRAALKRVGEDARREAFAAGRAIMVAEDGQLVLLHPDGTRELLGPLPRSVPAKKSG